MEYRGDVPPSMPQRSGRRLAGAPCAAPAPPDLILTVARVYGAGDRRHVAQERGRIDWRIRSALNWHSRWCLYPTHELGRVVAPIEAEEASAGTSARPRAAAGAARAGPA